VSVLYVDASGRSIAAIGTRASLAITATMRKRHGFCEGISAGAKELITALRRNKKTETDYSKARC